MSGQTLTVFVERAMRQALAKKWAAAETARVASTHGL